MSESAPALDLALVASRYVLGLVPVESLPAVATDALVAGWDADSLRVLAGLNGAPSEARDLFERSVAVLGLALPPETEALAAVAHAISADIVDERVTPYVGAKQIWEASLRVEARAPLLDPFIYAASEWEDRPEDRALFEEGIVATAAGLLAD
jgi:hypothetical protein